MQGAAARWQGIETGLGIGAGELLHGKEAVCLVGANLDMGEGSALALLISAKRLSWFLEPAFSSLFLWRVIVFYTKGRAQLQVALPQNRAGFLIRMVLNSVILYQMERLGYRAKVGE